MPLTTNSLRKDRPQHEFILLCISKQGYKHSHTAPRNLNSGLPALCISKAEGYVARH